MVYLFSPPTSECIEEHIQCHPTQDNDDDSYELEGKELLDFELEQIIVMETIERVIKYFARVHLSDISSKFLDEQMGKKKFHREHKLMLLVKIHPEMSHVNFLVLYAIRNAWMLMLPKMPHQRYVTNSRVFIILIIYAYHNMAVHHGHHIEFSCKNKLDFKVDFYYHNFFCHHKVDVYLIYIS